jgi:hypothetical protein
LVGRGSRIDSRVFPGRRCRLLLLPAMTLVSGISKALETGIGLLRSVDSDDVTRIGDMLSGPMLSDLILYLIMI